MKSVLKVKSKNTQVTQEKIEPKYVEDKATEQYLDYINESGNVMRHNGDKYVNTGINLKGPRGAVGPRGLPGKDGITPHIGENGNWYIGEQDTGNKAAFDLTFTETTYPAANGHEYVDLGLPSGTLWATCNVGANAPEEYGDYYMYGMGNKIYDAEDTPYDGTEDPLDLSRDTARQVMGGAWHMPTKAQMQELIANTTLQWVTNYKDSVINGGLFTATNGAVLFLPTAGNWSDGSLGDVGVDGYYWSSSPVGNEVYLLDIYDGGNDIFYNDRHGFGYSVRGVLDAAEVEPTTTTYTANRVVIPIDSSKNAATGKSVINTDTIVPYITDIENYLVIKESKNLHSGTVIVEANLSGKGLCCPANMMYKEGQYYIYPSLPLDNIKDNLKDLILYCYQIEDYVAPATSVTAHKLWFDDFPEDNLERIIDSHGFDNWEDFVAYLVENANKDTTGANGFIYTGETFNWNGTEYYLWETDTVVGNIPYIITDTIDYNELYPNSLEADSSNKYCPYVAMLTDDMEAQYTRENERGDILIKVEPEE